MSEKLVNPPHFRKDRTDHPLAGKELERLAANAPLLAGVLSTGGVMTFRAHYDQSVATEKGKLHASLSTEPEISYPSRDVDRHRLEALKDLFGGYIVDDVRTRLPKWRVRGRPAFQLSSYLQGLVPSQRLALDAFQEWGEPSEDVHSHRVKVAHAFKAQTKEGQKKPQVTEYETLVENSLFLAGVILGSLDNIPTHTFEEFSGTPSASIRIENQVLLEAMQKRYGGSILPEDKGIYRLTITGENTAAVFDAVDHHLSHLLAA